MAQDRSPGPADRGLPNIFALQVGKESIVAVVGAAAPDLLPGGLLPATVITKRVADHMLAILQRLVEQFLQPPVAKSHAADVFDVVLAKRRKRT